MHQETKTIKVPIFHRFMRGVMCGEEKGKTWIKKTEDEMFNELGKMYVPHARI